MSLPDIINGSYEVLGGFMIWLSIRKLFHDKMVRGVHWAPMLFFATWGLWNLYYYPYLGQWVSCVGASATAAAKLDVPRFNAILYQT
jgi:hypothetical protein